MSLYDSLKNKIEAQLDVWEKQLVSLKSEAEEELAEAKRDHANAKLKEEIALKIESLQKKIEDAKDKIEASKDAGSEKLKKIKSDVEAWFD